MFKVSNFIETVEKLQKIANLLPKTLEANYASKPFSLNMGTVPNPFLSWWVDQCCLMGGLT